MSNIIVIDEEFTGTCQSYWGVNECPNIAEWHIISTTNDSHAYMCTPHKEGFRAQFPDAYVTYEQLPNEVS